MEKRKLSPEALALICLREQRRWTQRELAAAKGISDYRLISRYENAEKILSRAELDEFARLLGYSREAVDALLFSYSLVVIEPPPSSSPMDLSREELRRIDRAVLADGWTRAALLRARLVAGKRKRKAEDARREAGKLWARLKPFAHPARRELVADAPEFRTWALAQILCQESRRAAAHDSRQALELADLALLVAGRIEGEDAWRSRLSGYAWAYKANSLRVAGHLDKAGEAFARAWQLWNAGASLEPDLLPEWNMLSLEASLRREEHQFAEALELLARAAKGAGGEPADVGTILLKKEFVCEQIGDLAGALAALAEATPYVEASGDDRLLWVLHFETAKALSASKQYDEAEAPLAAARELAERLGNALDLVRVGWLAARIAAGQGRREEALAGLEQVRRELVARAIPYDAALASLELAVLYLEEGHTGEVKALAREMAPILQAQGIAREALASLTLFVEAAQKEIATVELVRRVITDIEGARRKAPRPQAGPRG
jgi:transcriptional regulator with XRE-family HTH domain